MILESKIGIANGYPCFVVSIAMIGLCTAFIGDIAGHLGCFIFLKDSVNAIAFVALGTSVPGRIGRDLRNTGASGRSFSDFSFWLCIYPCPIENAKNQQYSRPNLCFEMEWKKRHFARIVFLLSSFLRIFNYLYRV